MKNCETRLPRRGSWQGVRQEPHARSATRPAAFPGKLSGTSCPDVLLHDAPCTTSQTGSSALTILHEMSSI